MELIEELRSKRIIEQTLNAVSSTSGLNPPRRSRAPSISVKISRLGDASEEVNTYLQPGTVD